MDINNGQWSFIRVQKNQIWDGVCSGLQWWWCGGGQPAAPTSLNITHKCFSTSVLVFYRPNNKCLISQLLLKSVFCLLMSSNGMIRFEHSIVCVCPGGGVTGAVFNPALAFSIQFSCSGSTFVESGLVYWISPVLGEQSRSHLHH